ncbi:MAG: vWA domain-containing protein [Bryobacteraceae bacterium]
MLRHFLAKTTLAMAAVLTLAGDCYAQFRNNIVVDVPQRLGGGQLGISQIQIRVVLSQDVPVAFQISNSVNAPAGLRFPAAGTMSPDGAVTTRDFAFAPPPGALAADSITIQHPPMAAANDPTRRVYTITISTLSDYRSDNCTNAMTGPEQWTIAVVGGASIIEGACVLSWDKNTAINQCQNDLHFIPVSDTPFATLNGFPNQSNQACATSRPGVDAILVLDRSGSMSSMTLGAMSRIKMDALKSAASDFIDIWDQIRTTEGAGAPNDRIGMNLFDTTPQWANAFAAPCNAVAVGLNDFAARKTDVRNCINDVINTGGMTALGGGVLAADGQFAAPAAGKRSVMLVMSNGMQNQNPYVGVNNNANPTQVTTYPPNNPGGAVALPNQANYQIYSVSVGTSTAVSATILQNIARARGGFYVNTEDNAEQMRPFFLELLQNFVHFNSYETLRMVSGTVSITTPYSLKMPLATSTRAAVFVVMAPPRMGTLRLTVAPPAGTPMSASGSGRVSIPINLPLQGPAFDPRGDWTVTVTAADTPRTPVPFDLMVIADDLALKGKLRVANGDFVPGKPVRLQADLREFGKGIRNIPGTPAGQVVAQLVRPDATIGDLLSNNQASGPPPEPNTSAADAKLFALLQQNPGLLKKAQDTITLRDDGNAANGDDVANDGIYSALYTPAEPGHYTFQYAIQGTSTSLGRFTRQQIETVNIRSIPDPQQTQVQTSSSNGQVLVTFTPKTRTGSKMGPGFGNYFWLKSGSTAVHATDNLDGTYKATVPSGSISLHFLDVGVIIDDSVTEDKLPVKLDTGTVLVANVGGGGGLPWFLILLLILLLIALLLFLFLRKKP